MYVNNLQGGYSMERKFDRKIVFEDGTEYLGYGFGAECESVGEMVYNTSMAGYQEIVTDLSYAGQIALLTYPIIGSYGITDEDFESKNPAIRGLIVRDYNDMPSNFRYTKTLGEFLAETNIPGIYGVDTRKITRYLRNNGTKYAIITNAETPAEDAISRIKEAKKVTVRDVSCKKKWYSRTSNHKYNIVAIDCGIKLSYIKGLNQRGANVTVVPFDTTADEIRFMKPDGVFISNGPGNPADAKEVIETIKAIRGEFSIFGVGLGCQIIALSYGADTYKMKTGHRGSNNPIRNLETDKIEIATQNHGYAIDRKSLTSTDLTLTHENVLDKTVEGVECKKDGIFGVQHEPDSMPATNDTCYHFAKFIEKIEEGLKNA